MWLTSQGVCALRAGDLDTAIDDVAAACEAWRASCAAICGSRREKKRREITDLFATYLQHGRRSRPTGGRMNVWPASNRGQRDGERDDGGPPLCGIAAGVFPPRFCRVARTEAGSAVHTAMRLQGRDITWEDLLDDQPTPGTHLIPACNCGRFSGGPDGRTRTRRVRSRLGARSWPLRAGLAQSIRGLVHQRTPRPRHPAAARWIGAGRCRIC